MVVASRGLGDQFVFPLSFGFSPESAETVGKWIFWSGIEVLEGVRE